MAMCSVMIQKLSFPRELDMHWTKFLILQQIQSPTELWEKKTFQFTGAACL